MIRETCMALQRTRGLGAPGFGKSEQGEGRIQLVDDPDGRLEAVGAHTLLTGDVTPLGRDVIHAVTNPLPEPTGAIHVYGGDFFAVDRSEWDAEALVERAWDIDRVRALFGS